MFSLARPAPEDIAALLVRSREAEFTYSDVGCTRREPPATFTIDRHATVLGQGDEAWTRAKAAVRAWRMFDLGWVQLFDPGAPIEERTTVAVQIRSVGLWSLNAARIVYVVDEPDRFGFAYGTLPEHAESGEERFLVARDASAQVTYDILACSRPRHPLARFAHPWVRHLQHRFGRDSLRAMERAAR